MSNEVSFGGWLKQRRKDQGITQEELARHIGCSQFTLQKIENGDRRPSGQIANLLADYFRVPNDQREAFVAFARAGRTRGKEASAGGTPAGAGVDARSPWLHTFRGQTNLPAMLTPLVGRKREQEEVRAHLLNPKVRLLTLTGPPGIGKTRLGLHMASDMVNDFEDGVFFVDLSAVIDPDLVLPVIARTLGVKETEDLSIEEALLAHLGKRRILLFLDNFEQVLDAAPQVVRLMQGSPWLKTIVTSREPLHVRGEQRFPVPPLEFPDLNSLPAPETVASYPSVELFVERARATAPDFALTGVNAEAVATVCAGLEGLPLAIELCAARANYLSPWEMQTVLNSRLGLLTGGGRDLPARQRTLASAIAWSYDLLNSGEQELFRKLGVFVGGFTRAAAEAVWGDQGSVGKGQVKRANEVQAADLLRSLADKSLVKPESLNVEGREIRFGMLEAIREYALDRLNEIPEEAGSVKQRHARYFMAMAEEAEPHLAGAEQVRWLDRLEQDHDNIRMSLSWAVEHGRSQRAAELGLRTTGALPRFWYKRGYISEGRERFAATLAASPALDELRPYRAKTLEGAGILAHLQGDYLSARRLYEEALAVRHLIGDKPGAGFVLNQLGMVAHEQGDNAHARALHEDGLAIYREVGDRMGIGNSLNQLAGIDYEQEDYITARALFEEALAIRREHGDQRLVAHSLMNLGLVQYHQQDYTAARALFEESLAIWRRFGDDVGAAHVLDHLSMVAYAQGDYPSVLALLRESLIIRSKISSNIHILNNLVGFGELAVASGQLRRGVRLLGATAAHWEAMSVVPEQDSRRNHEAAVASAQAQLEADAFSRAWAEGKAMTIEEAIAYALSDT